MDAVAAWAERPDAGEIILAGDGLAKYRSQYEEAGFARFASEDALHPVGEGLIRAAAAVGTFDGESAAPANSGDPALVLPVYTRLSDAEENEAKRLGLASPATVTTTGCDDAALRGGSSGVVPSQRHKTNSWRGTSRE